MQNYFSVKCYTEWTNSCSGNAEKNDVKYSRKFERAAPINTWTNFANRMYDSAELWTGKLIKVLNPTWPGKCHWLTTTGIWQRRDLVLSTWSPVPPKSTKGILKMLLGSLTSKAERKMIKVLKAVSYEERLRAEVVQPGEASNSLVLPSDRKRGNGHELEYKKCV